MKNKPSNPNWAVAPAVAGLLINSRVSVSEKIILIKKWLRLAEEWQQPNQRYQSWLGRLAPGWWWGGGLPPCCCRPFVCGSNPGQNNSYRDSFFILLIFVPQGRLSKTPNCLIIFVFFFVVVLTIQSRVAGCLLYENLFSIAKINEKKSFNDCNLSSVYCRLCSVICLGYIAI